jgi:hypothetical protein
MKLSNIDGPDKRWIVIVAVVSVLFGGLLGGVVGFAVEVILNGDMIIYELTISNSVAMLATLLVFAYFAADDVIELLSKVYETHG